MHVRDIYRGWDERRTADRRQVWFDVLLYLPDRVKRPESMENNQIVPVVRAILKVSFQRNTWWDECYTPPTYVHAFKHSVF